VADGGEPTGDFATPFRAAHGEVMGNFDSALHVESVDMSAPDKGSTPTVRLLRGNILETGLKLPSCDELEEFLANRSSLHEDGAESSSGDDFSTADFEFADRGSGGRGGDRVDRFAKDELRRRRQSFNGLNLPSDDCTDSNEFDEF
jgi:hypothetical protein